MFSKKNRDYLLFILIALASVWVLAALKWLSVPLAKSMTLGILAGGITGIILVKVFRIEKR